MSPKHLVLPIAMGALTALVAWRLWDITGLDILNFLVPWFRHISAVGPVEAFAAPFGNYAPLYLYLLATTTLASQWVDPITLIKLLSLAGNAALALAIGHLVSVVGAPAQRRPLAGAATLALPTVFLNGLVMGQCDAMWAAACVLALAAAMQRRHRAMLLWCGIAFAFKLQAVFGAPLMLGLLLRRRVPPRWWGLAPAAWIATLVPAWLAGWPASDLLTIYGRQAATAFDTPLNPPNIWTLVEPLLPVSSWSNATAYAAAAAGAGWLVLRASTRDLSGRTLLEAATLAPMIVVGLLPHMHERYFFLADVLTLATALAWPDRRSVAIAVLVQLGSLLAYAAYFNGLTTLAGYGAVAMLWATIRLIQSQPTAEPMPSKAILAHA